MSRGAVAAGHPQTAAAGAEMLKRGGNAVDAAVAATFASFVAEASIVNIGGGGVAMVADSHTPHRTAYDFFSTMPSGPLTDRADFRRVLIDFGPEQQPFYIGRASVAVPGVVAGLCAMAADYGRLPLATLLEPAGRLAREGAILTPGQAFAYRLLQPIFNDTPELAALYVPGGRMLQEGERLYFSALAGTLERLGAGGADLFYRGDLAEAMVADQTAHGGLMTAADLAEYRVHTGPPITVRYRGHQVLLPPPASAGGVLVGFALQLLETEEVGALAHNGPAHLRLLAEVMRLTNVARVDWERSTLDPAACVAWFLSEDHIGPYRAQLAAILAGSPPPVEPTPLPGPNDTTHVSVVDEAGLLASVTTSAGENAGFVVGDTGICLNNMLGELDLHPNGFHQLPPGVRLSTMMTPVMVVRDDKPVLAVGSGGSNRIRSAILQVLSNVLDFHLVLDQAVNLPRVHFEAGILQVEGGMAPAGPAELSRLGYRLNVWPARNMFFGGAHAVGLEDGVMVAAGDRRRGGVGIA